MSEENKSEMSHRLSGLAEFAIKRPITITMIFVSLVTIGFISSQMLPLEQWPKIKTPQLSVRVNYPSATPKEVERNITRPLEEAFATIGGIKSMNSNSNLEGSRIWMQFESDADIDEKTMLVQEQIDLTKPLLPDDVRRINIRKNDMNDGAIMEIRLTGDLDLENSYDVINKYLVQPIERVPGVAAVEFQGLEPKEIRIIIDNDALKKYGIGFNELSQKLRQANFAIPSGNFKTGDHKGSQQLRVVPKGQMRDVEEFRNIVLNDYGVRLSDVAQLEVVNGDRNYARHLERKYSVGLEIFNESTSNLVDVADRVLKKIDEISQTPQMSGIQLVFLRNQAESVRKSLQEVIMAGVLGALLSLIVLYVFIRDVATTLIVSLSIPISIAITLGALYFLGMTLNILSLMGLMLAIGMLVDNSVVVSESIFTRKSSGQFELIAAIKKGVSDVMIPVIAGTMTSICVFLPIMFGQENMVLTFLSHVAASIIAALIVSLFLSLTVVPLIISRLKNQTKIINIETSKFERFKNRYANVLNFTLSHRWLTFFFVVLVAVIGIVSAKFVKTDDGFSQGQNRDFWLLYHVDGSFSLPRLKKDVDIIEDFLYANQERFEIRTVYSYYEENGFVGTRIYLVDEDKAQKPVTEIKTQILKDLPNITIGKPNFRWGRGMGSDGISVYLRGDSQEVMHKMLPDLLFELESIEGVTGAQVEQRNQREEIQIQVNRERATRLGLDPTMVAQSVNIAMRGLNLREVVTDMGEMPVIMRFYRTNEFKMEQLKQLPLKSQNGNQVTLETVAEIKNVQSPQSIRRNNRMGAVGIDIDLEDEVNQKEIRAKIETSMNKVNYPNGYSWTFNRMTRDRGVQFDSLVTIIFIAIALIFIVMAALFESLLFPLCVITCILFSYVGVLLLFALTGTAMGIMGMIGMLILIGVVVNNGIVLVDHINQLRISGMSRREAVIQGGKDRIRPILMTVMTTVVGLIPLALSMSTVGGEQGPAYFPMARAIIGGLIFSTIVSLLILPSLYVWLDDLRHWFFDRLKTKTVSSNREDNSLEDEEEMANEVL
jgi:HAE1 family hydrophobic/amphiphilic exporter-1